MKVLVLNSGSSSIKYKLYAMPENKQIASGSITSIGEEKSEAVQKSERGVIKIVKPIADHEVGITIIKDMLLDQDKGVLTSLSEVEACGHRVLHCGEKYSEPVLIDETVESVIEECIDLGPLHNPPNLMGIRAAKKMFGNIPQVACIDTAFHATMPERAYLYPVPLEIYRKYRVRKYGFHGTSHRYVSRRAAQLLGRDPMDVDLVTCHLGNGCSVTAVKKGQSIDTSMGLTPLEGLMMGTRSGNIDPAVIFFLMRKGYTAEQLDALLNKKSGLLGISEYSNDMRNLDTRAQEGDKQALLAIEMFTYRIRQYVGSYLAVLGGADAIVICGGIGEHEGRMRANIFGGLEKLGIVIDAERNKAAYGIEAVISTDTSPIKVIVIPTDEEGSIAQDTYALASKVVSK